MACWLVVDWPGAAAAIFPVSLARQQLAIDVVAAPCRLLAPDSSSHHFLSLPCPPSPSHLQAGSVSQQQQQQGRQQEQQPGQQQQQQQQQQQSGAALAAAAVEAGSLAARQAESGEVPLPAVWGVPLGLVEQYAQLLGGCPPCQRCLACQAGSQARCDTIAAVCEWCELLPGIQLPAGPHSLAAGRCGKCFGCLHNDHCNVRPKRRSHCWTASRFRSHGAAAVERLRRERIGWGLARQQGQPWRRQEEEEEEPQVASHSSSDASNSNTNELLLRQRGQPQIDWLHTAATPDRRLLPPVVRGVSYERAMAVAATRLQGERTTCGECTVCREASSARRAGRCRALAAADAWMAAANSMPNVEPTLPQAEQQQQQAQQQPQQQQQQPAPLSASWQSAAAATITAGGVPQDQQLVQQGATPSHDAMQLGTAAGTGQQQQQQQQRQAAALPPVSRTAHAATAAAPGQKRPRQLEPDGPGGGKAPRPASSAEAAPCEAAGVSRPLAPSLPPRSE